MMMTIITVTNGVLEKLSTTMELWRTLPRVLRKISLGWPRASSGPRRRRRWFLFFYILLIFLNARCYASAVLAMGLCLSVCHKSEFYRNGWTNRAGFWHVSFLPPVLHCVKKSVISKNKGTFLKNFVLNSGLRKFRHGISIFETCYQLSSRKVDAHSVINWAVVGQLSR